jgi:hypothetical protein
MTMRESIVRVTPALAAKWLARHKQANDGNNGNWRAFQANHAEFLAYEILAGRFVASLSKIAIGEDGYIIDGQHRVNAVLLADTAVEFTVVEGAPRNWGEFADCGKTRSVSQRLQLPPRLTSVAATLLRVAYRSPSAGTAHATKDVLAKFAPALDALEGVKGWAGKQRHSPAPVRAMLVLRTMELGPTVAPLDVYSAYLRGDLETLALGGYAGLTSLYKAALDGSLQPMGNVGAQVAAAKAYAVLCSPKRKTIPAVKAPADTIKATVWPAFAKVMGAKSDSITPRHKLPGKAGRHAQA